MDSYLHTLKNYKNFTGRFSRKDYWWFVLINILVSMAISLVGGFLDSAMGLGQRFEFIVTVLYQIFMFIPSLAASVRRLHDIGRSGCWLLVPVVGFVMAFFKSQPYPNRYGEVTVVDSYKLPSDFMVIFLSPFVKMLFAVCFFLIAVQCIRYPEKFREYRLHLTESRPKIDLHLRQLSQALTENDLKRQFSTLNWNCYTNNPGENFDKRTCYADISSFNDMPAMFIGFHFAPEGLNHMTVAIPWWHHRALMDYVTSSLGVAQGVYPDRKGGVPLMGWKLVDGNAVFVNKRIHKNPMDWNLIYWSSQRACLPKGCFNDKLKNDYAN